MLSVGEGEGLRGKSWCRVLILLRCFRGNTISTPYQLPQPVDIGAVGPYCIPLAPCKRSFVSY